jgi:hypothetical protein
VITFGDIVPTGLAVRQKTVYLAEAGPVPHLPENGKIVRFPGTPGRRSPRQSPLVRRFWSTSSSDRAARCTRFRRGTSHPDTIRARRPIRTPARWNASTTTPR